MPLTLKIDPRGTPKVIGSRSGWTEKKRGPRRELAKGDITISTFNNKAYPASKGMLHVKIGKYNVVVKQRELKHYRYFDVNVQGLLEEVGTDVGGLTGMDDHSAEAQVPEHCIHPSGPALSRQDGLSKLKPLEEERDLVFDAKTMSSFSLF